MEATTKDLRLHTRELLAVTDRGQEVLITYRGQPRARLVPCEEPGRKALAGARNAVFGIWRGRSEQSVEEMVRVMRRSRYQP